MLLSAALMLAPPCSLAQSVHIEETHLDEGEGLDRPVARVVVRNPASRRLRTLWLTCEWGYGDGRRGRATDVVHDIPQGGSSAREVRGPAIQKGVGIEDVQCRTRRNAVYY
jgi:hypothetical protein